MKQEDLFQQRNNFYFSLSNVGKGGMCLGVLIGILAFVGGMLAGEQTRTWGSLLFNLMFFFSLALGGVAFGNMQDVVGSTWGGLSSDSMSPSVLFYPGQLVFLSCF